MLFFYLKKCTIKIVIIIFIYINNFIMKKLILTLFLTFTGIVNSQTVIQYDYMETSSPIYLTAGWFTPIVTATWATNISVTPTTSAVIYGLGNGSSANEQDWYSLPNVTGLNASRPHQLKFKLASQTFTGPAAATRGCDVGDFVDVQVSRNGGTYISELRITGNSNSIYPYTATGVINHNANGSYTNSAPPTGDLYTNPTGVNTTGYSTITLNIPAGSTELAFDFFCRVNANGEEWWIDNIELIEVIPLPVELISFEGSNTKQGNLLIWKTATEHNSDHYLIESSTTGEFNENSVIGIKPAAGNSTEKQTYTFIDNNFSQTINYYRLTQVDIDGQFKIYGPVAIDNTQKKTVIKIINLLGQEVDNTAKGILFEVYEDGTLSKIYK